MTNAIRPEHYQGNGIEAIDVIEGFGYGEGFRLGNVLKYTMRYAKTRNVADLEKAQTYLSRQIELAKHAQGMKELAK
jgi:hypothetical protein